MEGNEERGERAGRTSGEAERGEARSKQKMQAKQAARSKQGQRATRNMRSNSVRLAHLEQSQVEGLQRELMDHGFYSGPIDGLPGPRTRSALRRYYRTQANLAASGRLFSGGASALGLSESEIERVKGQREPERESAVGRQQTTTGDAAMRGSAQGRGARPRGQDVDRGEGTKRRGGAPAREPVEQPQQGTGEKGGSPDTGGSPNDATILH